MEPYSKLERLRELRDCAKTNHPDAQLTLALEYAKGNLGGVTKTQVAEFTLQVNPCTNLSIFQALVKNDPVKYPLHLCSEMYATMKIIADLTKFHETK